MKKGEIEESRLPITFDIVDFHAISESMKGGILEDGVIWETWQPIKQRIEQKTNIL